VTDDARLKKQHEAQIWLNRLSADPGMPEKDWRDLELALLQNFNERLHRLEDGGLSPEETPTQPDRRKSAQFPAVKEK
jgi:hypothetical protein